jgi:hypothetical protein
MSEVHANQRLQNIHKRIIFIEEIVSQFGSI